MTSFDDVLNFLQRGNGAPRPLEPADAVIVPAAVLGLSLVLGIVIAEVYRRTYRGLAYSRSFAFSLALLPGIIGLMIMVIGSNVAMAFGAFGALSIIRFRAAIKDNVDLVFVFLAVAVGFCVGSGNALAAITAAVVVPAAIAFLSGRRFGSVYSGDYLLRLRLPAGGAEAEARCRELFSHYLSAAVMLNLYGSPAGVEMTYSVRLRNRQDARRLVEELSEIEGVTGAALVGTRSEVET
jgi:hypothetical protein